MDTVQDREIEFQNTAELAHAPRAAAKRHQGSGTSLALYYTRSLFQFPACSSPAAHYDSRRLLYETQCLSSL